MFIYGVQYSGWALAVVENQIDVIQSAFSWLAYQDSVEVANKWLTCTMFVFILCYKPL